MNSEQQFYEGCGHEGPIRCIFLSEFHPVVGPKIACQVPDAYISKDIFDALNVYIIPKTPLQRCILTVNSLGHKIVGYPVRLDSQRYARNAYYFNLCFVCDSWARTVQFEPVVKKLAEYLIRMEEESNFLSSDETATGEPSSSTDGGAAAPRQRDVRIRQLLTTILHDLNEGRVCTTAIGSTQIFLKIITRGPNPPPVADHLVPVMRTAYARLPKQLWDLTTRQLLPHINGRFHVARIARESHVDIQLVRICLQNLVYYGVVRMLPLFKYSNVYMCTRALQRLTKEPELGLACRQFVAWPPRPAETEQIAGAVDGAAAADKDAAVAAEGAFADGLQVAAGPEQPTGRPLPSLQRILLMYSSMTHGVNLRTLCQRTNPREHGIDEQHLVMFGLLHQLIRCIHKYPVCTETPVGRQQLYTGLHNIDEICVGAGLVPTQIEEDIDSDPMLTVFWK